MSLTRKSLVSAMAVSMIALVAAACSEQAPTSPSRLSPISGANGMVQEYWVTMADEVPAPAPDDPASEPGEPAPAPAPGDVAPTPGPGGNTGSWPPGPPPTAAPGVPVPSAPSTHFRVSMKVNPEPVLHSGQPINDVASCRNLAHTWFYDVTLHGETGVKVNFAERENFFDGRFTSKSSGFELAPNGTVVLHVRWCSAYPRFHYTQHRFKGTDEQGDKVEIMSPWIALYAPGTN